MVQPACLFTIHVELPVDKECIHMKDFESPSLTILLGDDNSIPNYLPHSGAHPQYAPRPNFGFGLTSLLPDGVEVVNTEDGEIID